MKTSPTDNWPRIRQQSIDALPADIVEYIERVCQEDHPESQLIGVLHRVQSHFGYLPEEQMDAVAQLMQVPAAKVSGVATFYHFFRLQPQGKYQISVCMGTACYVRGADRVAQKFRDELGIDFGEVTTDGQFSLDQSRCLGTCGLAPVVMVNERVYPKVSPDRVPSLIEECRKRR